MSTKMLLHKFMGTAAAGGYANFFTPTTSTPKSTYTSTTYATAEQADVPISSDGWIKTYLLGDYDMDVFDRNGTQIASASADGINPQAASVTNDPNLVPNGSFETDSNEDGTPDSWVLTSFAGSTNARVSSDQRHGAHAMSFTSTGSGGGHVTTEDFIPVNPDVPVYIGFGIKSTDAGVRNVVDILWFTEGQATVSTTSVYDDDTANPTSWEFKSFHATPPSTAKYAKIRLYGCHSSDSTAGTTLYDDVQFRSVGIPAVSAVATHNEDYTLKLSDAGKTLLKTAADSTTRTWTIPLNSTVPFPIGTRIWGENQDDNALTITATGAATLINLNGSAPSDGDVTISQGQGFELYQYAANLWSIKSDSGLVNFPGASVQVVTLELGHATDTTFSRPAAGRAQIEGREIVTAAADATTLTSTIAELNKTDDSAADISNYVSGMRTYLHVNGGPSTSLDIVTNITENTYESIGPTGSGATNIWTALDDLPAAARIALVSFIGTAQGSTDTNQLIEVFARQTGQSGGLDEERRVFYFAHVLDDNASMNNGAVGSQPIVPIPLDSSRRLDVAWSIAGDAVARDLDVYLKGFIL